MKPGDDVRIKVDITDGDGMDSPHVLIASAGTVLQINYIEDPARGSIVVRHHDVTDHPGFGLATGEYELASCRCNHVMRKEPCWQVPIPMKYSPRGPLVCAACGHTDTCHTHTDKLGWGKG